MLDRLAVDPFPEANISEVDPRQIVVGVTEKYTLQGSERVVIIFHRHLRPAEERTRVRITGRKLERLLERGARRREIPGGDCAPPAVAEGRAAEVVGAAAPGRLRRSDGPHRLILFDERAEVVFEEAEVGDRSLHVTEQRKNLLTQTNAVCGGA